eukprot:10905-Rhodomonas_salina.1
MEYGVRGTEKAYGVRSAVLSERMALQGAKRHAVCSPGTELACGSSGSEKTQISEETRSLIDMEVRSTLTYAPSLTSKHLTLCS